MIAIIDYGMGNLHSVAKGLQRAGGEPRIISHPEEIGDAQALILPGVGAFGQGMERLRQVGFPEAIAEFRETGKPIMGICLGLQLLFEESEEMGQHQGLDLFPGRVLRFEPPLVVPHMGWNQIWPVKESPLLRGIEPGSYAYFVHSYYAAPSDPNVILATTDYGIDFASIVGMDNIYGLQFHPEKSQQVGLRILTNLVGLL
jgi:glutamine amidotransferase